jgi:hypothetical protein
MENRKRKSANPSLDVRRAASGATPVLSFTLCDMSFCVHSSIWHAELWFQQIASSFLTTFVTPRNDRTGRT